MPRCLLTKNTFSLARPRPQKALLRERLPPGVAVVCASLLAGCSSGVLDPKGPIGEAERSILLNSLVIMLFVVVPVIVLTLAFAWWFRASNPRAKYLPTWAYSGPIEFVTWSIPILIVMFLGGIAWVGSHDLDPWRPLDSKATPVEVQVISLDWKWLFIYPDKGIASVNELVVPVGTPIHFRLTSATVMNSFFVPQLGSQIYTMAGMESQLHLLANESGEFDGISAQFSGAGFSEMRFKLRAVSEADYTGWIGMTKAAGGNLDFDAYLALLEPGVEKKPHTYGTVAAGLFETAVMHSATSSHSSQDAAARASQGTKRLP